MTVSEGLSKKGNDEQPNSQVLAWRAEQSRPMDAEQSPDTTIESAAYRFEQTKQTLKSELDIQSDQEAKEVSKDFVTDKTIATIDSAKKDGIITPAERDDIDATIAEAVVASQPDRNEVDRQLGTEQQAESRPTHSPADVSTINTPLTRVIKHDPANEQLVSEYSERHGDEQLSDGSPVAEFIDGTMEQVKERRKSIKDSIGGVAAKAMSGAKILRDFVKYSIDDAKITHAEKTAKRLLRKGGVEVFEAEVKRTGLGRENPMLNPHIYNDYVNEMIKNGQLDLDKMTEAGVMDWQIWSDDRIINNIANRFVPQIDKATQKEVYPALINVEKFDKSLKLLMQAKKDPLTWDKITKDRNIDWNKIFSMRAMEVVRRGELVASSDDPDFAKELINRQDMADMAAIENLRKLGYDPTKDGELIDAIMTLGYDSEVISTRQLKLQQLGLIDDNLADAMRLSVLSKAESHDEYDIDCGVVCTDLPTSNREVAKLFDGCRNSKVINDRLSWLKDKTGIKDVRKLFGKDCVNMEAFADNVTRDGRTTLFDLSYLMRMNPGDDKLSSLHDSMVGIKEILSNIVGFKKEQLRDNAISVAMTQLGVEHVVNLAKYGDIPMDKIDGRRLDEVADMSDGMNMVANLVGNKFNSPSVTDVLIVRSYDLIKLLLHNLRNIGQLDDESKDALASVLAAGNYFGIKSVDELKRYDDVVADKLSGDLYNMNGIRGMRDSIMRALMPDVNLTGIKAEDLRSAGISDDKVKIFELMTDRNMDKIDFLAQLEEVGGLAKLVENGGALRSIRREYMRYIENDFNKSMTNLDDVKTVGRLESSEPDKPIDVKMLDGEPFMMLNHTLSTSMTFNASNGSDYGRMIGDPAIWDTAVGIQTVSTSLISNNYMVSVPVDEGGVSYGFTHIPQDALFNMGPKDLMTGYLPTTWQTIGRESNAHITTAEKIVEESVSSGAGREDAWNEIVLYREKGDTPGKKRVQPTCIIVHGNSMDDINENSKRAAEYFGVPVVIIDDSKYIKGQNDG